jgi:hypothetical protein
MQNARTLFLAAMRAFLLTVVILYLITSVNAQVMTSGNFQIDSDSINFGGGYSTSSSYRQESTFGEIATGDGVSTNYRLRAGYQQMLESYISLSTIANTPLTPALGLAGGTSNGSSTFTVVTDNRAGYRVTIHASNTPALRSGANSIANYAPSGANPDFTFTVPANTARFGFSPEGVNVATRFRDNGSVCSTGSGDTVLACWDMVSTTPVEIVRGTAANHPTGATTTLRFRVGIGSSAAVTAGSYIATTTVTAITL